MDRRYYAIKANPHPEILRTLAEEGFWLECVSLGEIERVFEALPGFDPRRVLFTPSFAPIGEYQAALARGVTVTVDNVELLQRWPEVFRGRALWLRIDLGHGDGHHEKVNTGGKEAKFGLSAQRVEEFAQAARALDVTHPDDLLVSCGTSWVGFQPVPERRIAAGVLLDPFLGEAGGPWGRLFSVAQIGLEIEQWIRGRFGDAPDRYATCNAEALAGDTPSRRMMRAIIGRFKARLGSRRPRRLVMAGGPAEGAAWPVLLAHELEIPVGVSPFHQDAGAVGAARLAGAPPVRNAFTWFAPDARLPGA